jgi:glycosyltransferase involved in cell wall biosynthesis
LLVFADDWGRHPSSCQHLIRHLLDRRRVLWVNTIGTRKPRLDWSTVTRGLEKLRHWLRPRHNGVALPDNLRIANPRMWPWLSTKLARGINRRLLERQLVPLITACAEQPIGLTTLPIVACVMDRLPVRRWVYYCVDDFSQWPGLDGDTLRHLEEELVGKAEVVIAVSENLQGRLAGMGRSSHLLTHGVDLEHWSKASTEPLPELAGVPRPLVVFWGIADRRMDVALVNHLAQAMTEGAIVLVGPQSDPNPALFTSPRVVYRPSMPYQQLPRLAGEASVLIMPYADLPVTRAMQPLKLKEYLATSKPVVVRDLPAVREWADCLDVAESPEAFTQAVLRRLTEGLPKAQEQARARLIEEGWAAKARQLEAWAMA